MYNPNTMSIYPLRVKILHLLVPLGGNSKLSRDTSVPVRYGILRAWALS